MNYSILDPRRPMVHPGASAYRRYDLISERTYASTHVGARRLHACDPRACLYINEETSGRNRFL